MRHGMTDLIPSIKSLSTSGASGHVKAVLRQVSVQSGANFSYLVALAQRESGFDPQAKARTSSAAGLFQFVEQTWLATVKRYGAHFGLGAYADDIRQVDGEWRASSPETLKHVLDLRFDPAAAASMAAASTEENRQVLKSRLGREPGDKELYLAHFLGAGGAAKLIAANPADDAAALFPAAAKANASLFYKNGAPRSCAELKAALTSNFGAGRGAEPAAARVASTGQPSSAAFAPSKLASPARWTRWLPPSLDMLALIDPISDNQETERRKDRPDRV